MSLGWERSVHDKPAFSMNRGKLSERLRNSGMVQESCLIDPIDMRRIGQPPSQSGFRRHIDENAQVWIHVLHREGLDRFEVDQREVISTPLVGQGRIDKPVGDDDVSPVDRR